MWHFGETAPVIPVVLVDEKPLIPTRSHFPGYFHCFAGCGKTLINFNEIFFLMQWKSEEWSRRLHKSHRAPAEEEMSLFYGLPKIQLELLVL